MSASLPRDLPAETATPDGIAEYGTLILPAEDGTPFGMADARLDLGRGIPRCYVMTLHWRPLLVRGITRHRRVTQCLAALGRESWLIVLAPPGDPDRPDAVPDEARLKGFRIPGGTALALHRGTWHAGPYFASDSLDFLNLELSDTNIVDHHTVPLDPVRRLVPEPRP